MPCPKKKKMPKGRPFYINLSGSINHSQLSCSAHIHFVAICPQAKHDNPVLNGGQTILKIESKQHQGLFSFLVFVDLGIWND